MSRFVSVFMYKKTNLDSLLFISQGTEDDELQKQKTEETNAMY